MLELNGKYTTAKVYTDMVEQTAIAQIIDLCNQEACKDTEIRIMPDVHAGVGCVIGTTMQLKDKVIPSLIGVDVGCGMYNAVVSDKTIDLSKLDSVVRKFSPPIGALNTLPIKEELKDQAYALFFKLSCKGYINLGRVINSLGTLGGGNHFIEVGKADKGFLCITIHSGSRYLGAKVAKHYQELAYKTLTNNQGERLKIINTLKEQGRQKEIESALKALKTVKIRKSMAYLTGEDFNNYLKDVELTSLFAACNRMAMMDIIVKSLGLNVIHTTNTPHNYVENGILRKGAIAAPLGKELVIPLNMRDGIILGIGKGNPDWNYSAPHGAGRVLSRSQAKEVLTMQEYKDSMKGIYTTSVAQSTLDEAPMAYKPKETIIDNISDTVEIVDIVKPIYNYKASEVKFFEGEA